jgi:Ribbon-helix-helix domain
MSNTLTIRLPEEMLAWLKETSRQTGIPVGRLIREQLESAKAQGGKPPFMRHAGTMSGPPDLSSRKGYSRK